MHWGAALAASTIDLFRDVDYYFSHILDGTGYEFTPSEMHALVFS